MRFAWKTTVLLLTAIFYASLMAAALIYSIYSGQTQIGIKVASINTGSSFCVIRNKVDALLKIVVMISASLRQKYKRIDYTTPVE